VRPPSREAPGGDRPLSLPSKVTLTAEEKDAARFSMQAKARGEIA
jgi:hypothetical protein